MPTPTLLARGVSYLRARNARNGSTRELDPTALRDAIVARLPHRSAGSGQFRWPAIPALLDQYLDILLALFAGLGRSFDEAETRALRELLARELNAAFEASPYSKLVVEYATEDPPSTALNYEIKREVITVADEYDDWVRTRTPPLFGANPDAKLMALAHAFGAPESVAVLDVGAGTGRNTLPLARAGFQVDAVELAPALVAVLRQDIGGAGANAQVFEGDALDPSLAIPTGKYQLVVLAEVVASHFRDQDQLRQLFERATTWLAPSGVLLFSAFVATDGYEPDALARQASQVFWSCLFTRGELAEASRGLPLRLVSDESTYSFERRHLPKEAWPPTGWFSDWARGRDLFHLPVGKSPHELRWLAYRKTAQPSHARAHWHAVTVTQHIEAPRERVFELAVDAQRAAELFRGLLPVPGIKSRELLDGSELVAGGRRRTLWTDTSCTTEEILELEAPFRYAYQWRNELKGPLGLLFLEAESEWMFVPTSTGTLVYWTYRFAPRHPVLSRVMNIVQGGFDRWMRASLKSLAGKLAA